ncbi:MAG: RraA family protein [Solobacterium sp.]|nr:RraA family protein [Solobacterium sp.]
MELTKELLEKLALLPSGNVADSNPNGGVMDPEIRPLDPTLHLIGRAVTVDCAPGDNLALHQGIEAAGEGDVLVFDCKGYKKGGHFGDMMANACQVKGIAGVIINGSCRDAEDIRALKFPVYARALCPAHTVKETLARINVPVCVGDVTVYPGDLIFGDCDGVVVIHKEDEDSVIPKALEKFEYEKEVIRRLRAGESTMSVYGFDKLVAAKQK